MAETASKTPILGKSIASPEQMAAFVRRINPNAPDYSRLYLAIGAKYGIRGDLAFAQSIKETGAWRFGNLVEARQNNFAGLGATGPGRQGASFSTPEEGIEAQIQHLYGYATAKPLPPGTRIVDPRFDLLESAGLRGSAPHWENLNGKWAVPGNNYGEDIVRLWRQMTQTSVPVSGGGNAPVQPPVPEQPRGGEELPETNAGGNPSQWKVEAMDWLKDEGLILSEHDPDAPVTWAEFGTVLRRLAEKLR